MNWLLDNVTTIYQALAILAGFGWLLAGLGTLILHLENKD